MPTNNGDITFKYGSQNAYNALTTTDTNAVYVTTDTHRIYIDGVDYTADTEMNNATKQYVDGQVGIIGERVDSIIAHNNDTEGNSELVDIRTGVDGTVYASAGVAVRTAYQNLSAYIDNLKAGLNYHAGNNYASFSLEQGHLTNGIETASTTRVRSTASSIITVDNAVSITITNNNTSTYKMFICIYNQDGTFHDALAWKSQSVYTYNLQSGYKYRFVFGKNDNTVLTVNDVMPVFSFLVGELRPYSLERIDQLEAQQSLILKRQNMILKNDSFFSIAHQGFHTVYANQTLNAYIAAGESGFNWAECDANVTSDGTIICCHNDIVYADTNTMRINPTLSSANSQFNIPIEIASTTYQELCRYDIAKWKNEELPTQTFATLEDVIKTAKKYNMGLVVDDFFKIYQANKSTEFCSMVRQYGMENKIAVITVNSYIAQNLPKAKYFAAGMASTWQSNLQSLQNIKNNYGSECWLNMQYNAITEEVKTAVRNAGIGLLAWTVNTLSDYKSIMPYVDGITSDYFTRFDTE